MGLSVFGFWVPMGCWVFSCGVLLVGGWFGIGSDSY